MTAKEFIFKELSLIKDRFRNFSPLYEYKRNSLTHFVQIVPDELDNNPEFEILCGEIIAKLMEDFPDENICFLNSGSLTELKSAEPVFSSDITNIEFTESIIVSLNSTTFVSDKIYKLIGISENLWQIEETEVANPIQSTCEIDETQLMAA